MLLAVHMQSRWSSPHFHIAWERGRTCRGCAFISLHIITHSALRSEETSALVRSRPSISLRCLRWSAPFPSVAARSFFTLSRGTRMADYTPLGIEKISLQAARDPHTIRCPRDSVVMRVLVVDAERSDGKEPSRRLFTTVPRTPSWRITKLDLECPACRRKALGIRPAMPAVPPVPPRQQVGMYR